MCISGPSRFEGPAPDTEFRDLATSREGVQELTGTWERPICVECGNDEGEEGLTGLFAISSLLGGASGRFFFGLLSSFPHCVRSKFRTIFRGQIALNLLIKGFTPQNLDKKSVNFGQSLDFLKFWKGNRGKQKENKGRRRKNNKN